jgi:hypothetical protein
MRMDLRTALTWRDEVEAALERAGRGRPPPKRPKAAPKGRTAFG